MTQGIIFDCFGVLSTGSLTYFANLAPLENRTAIYDVNKQADYGYITHEEHVRQIAELVGLSIAEIEQVFRTEHVLNQPLMEYVRSLRSRYKTAMLSNVGHGVIEKMFTEDDLHAMFDEVVLSAEVGTLKPHAEIYLATASRLGLLPEQCVMIDDIPSNVEGARMTGMKGLLYTSNRQIKVELETLLGQERA